MGKVFLNSLDQCGSGMEWQNLRKWGKNEFGQKIGQNTWNRALKGMIWFVWFGHDSFVIFGESWNV